MTHLGITGVADEMAWHRRTSPIGAPQRHYQLEPVLVIPEGVCDGVVIIAGARGTYAYASDCNGDIADFEPVAVAPPGTGEDDLLAVMGYAICARRPLRDLA